MTNPQANPSVTTAVTPGRARSACSDCRRPLIKPAILVGRIPAAPGCARCAAENHGPGQRAPHLDHLEPPPEKPHEPSLRPVAQVARRVAELTHIGEARQ